MKTNYGVLKFYSVKAKGKKDFEQILASSDSADIKSYYSFFPNKITKTVESSKQLIYTVIYEQPSESLNDKNYQPFSSLDILILTRGDNILNSYGLNNFKRFQGGKFFMIEVNYYHGYPKNKKFKP
jgi:hypothetical protein